MNTKPCRPPTGYRLVKAGEVLREGDKVSIRLSARSSRRRWYEITVSKGQVVQHPESYAYPYGCYCTKI